jgi:hypothetical protein
MGSYNQKDIYIRFSKFKELRCPICDNTIEINSNYKLESDSIDYYCSNCGSADKMISISGSVLCSENYNRILNDSNVKKYLMDKIRTAQGSTVSILMSDFR